MTKASLLRLAKPSPPPVPSKPPSASLKATSADASCLICPSSRISIRLRFRKRRRQSAGENNRSPLLSTRDRLHGRVGRQQLHHRGGRDERRQPAQDVRSG